ncbi:MAG TPA: serine hydrolase [Microbacterium sp.]|uniref:serine hydrolase n=2 Tax=Microbacterium TaxID=33882 RepID=UPI000C510DA0|nr:MULTISPECIES: serine hydrolase [unclassified Microbacterium]MBU20884.1 serine hydrolase [Microbacterium sp.]HBS08947.1 serine hydrolase [Microbacterium sp.]HBU41790.1 serine hydrolase [Microbacterium sp.]|tara:strand:+ start:2198 stop:3004 length:807 start_codon:yes stop_codon:yes gene_type:complete
MHALEQLANAGGRVSVCVTDLDRGKDLVLGDAFITLPVAQLGVVPLLIQVSAAIEAGKLDAAASVARPPTADGGSAGLWRHLAAADLNPGDLAVLTAAAADPLATNALIDLVGLDPVRERIEHLGLTRTALLDRVREDRGPDDAPHFALSTTRDLTTMFSSLANGRAVSAAVSAQVTGWLALNADLGLAAGATGLDPLAHAETAEQLLLVNKTGRDPGIRAEAGVLVGPRAGVAYAMIVQFTEETPLDRLRVHDAFRVFGADLMESVH